MKHRDQYWKYIKMRYPAILSLTINEDPYQTLRLTFNVKRGKGGVKNNQVLPIAQDLNRLTQYYNMNVSVVTIMWRDNNYNIHKLPYQSNFLRTYEKPNV